MRLTFVILAAATAAVASCNSTTAVQCSPTPLVVIEPSQVIMEIRDTLTISAHFGLICPGTPGNRAGVFFWQSGNKTIVTVDSLTGTLHAINTGQTTVTATDTLDRSVKGQALVLVTPRPGA